MAESFGTDDLDVSAAVDELRTRVFTQRLRVIALACMIVIAMLITASLLVGEALPRIYTPLRISGFASLAAFVVISHRPGFVRYQAVWAWVLVSGMAALAASGSVLRDNVATASILQTMLVLLTSAVVPWGVRVQAAMVATCSLLLAAVAYTLGPYPSDHPDFPVLIDAAAAFLLSLFVAHGTRSAFDAAASENLRLQAARAQIRSLADELEENVRSRTAELEATLTDQRSMTRAISHDLRQPLRHIAGFTQVLTDDLADGLEDGHRDQMLRVCRATARMDRMVDALLEISRVAGKPLERQRIDLSSMTRDLGDTLSRAEPDRSVDLRVDDELVADGDPGLVRNMLHALLANGWKFTRGRVPASVQVGRRGDAFFVRDNGSGFDMQHACKLFGTFERLHHGDEFEGEGVGLAIAERVVRRHGGRIWAESEPGRGAAFFFTLSPGDG